MAVPKTFTGGERLFAQDLNDNFQDLDGRLVAAQASATDASNLVSGTLNAERLPFKIAYGSGTSSNTGPVSVTFPAGLFTETPSFVVTCSDAGSARIATYSELTKDGAKVSTWSGGSNYNLTGFQWIAVGV